MTDIAGYLDIIASPQRRAESYDDMVRTYYEFATDPYLALWGESFHLTWFSDAGQDLASAQRAQELWVAESGGFGPGMSVLDIGCGIGGPAAAIAARTGAHVTGVNISPRQVEIARNRNREPGSAGTLRFELGDAMNLPAEWSASFDGAYSIEAICHTPDKGRVYQQVADVLRPGGAFVGCDWFTRDGISADAYARSIEPLCQMLALPYLTSLADLRAGLEAAGFRVESISSYRDHGDVSPNWTLFESVDGALGDTGQEQILRDSLGLLRSAADDGDFVPGCWVARLG